MPRKKIVADPEATLEPTPPVESPPAQPVLRAHDENILTISDQERGVTREDSAEIKWNYLMTAWRRHHILTGVVSAIETLESGAKVCAVDYQGIRVLIPAKEMFNVEIPDGDSLPTQISIRLNRILGATVDFLLTGVDVKGRAAVASRKEALKINIARYFDTGRVKEGILLTCRVTGIANNVVTVEALGVETSIVGRDLSWQWLSDVADYFAAGDLVVARVMKLEKGAAGEYNLKLSIREATGNPDFEAAGKLVPGSAYFGVVTGVKDNVIFVRLQAGVNAKTKKYMGDPPMKNDTVSFMVTRVATDHALALGYITRIVKKCNRLR